jgi:hypothetical protein
MTPGIAFVMIVFLVLLVLKMSGQIRAPWWWVTSPLWATAAMFALIVIAVAVVDIAAGVER